MDDKKGDDGIRRRCLLGDVILCTLCFGRTVMMFM